MKRLAIWITVGIIIVLVGIWGYGSVFGWNYKKNRMAMETQSYLNDKYGADKILLVEGIYSFKDSEYNAKVKFKDEPNAYYFYSKKDGKIVQSGSSGQIHLEE